MDGHVAIGQGAFFNFKQTLAKPTDQNGTERMIAVGNRDSRDIEAAAQECLVGRKQSVHGRSLPHSAVPYFSTIAAKIRSGLNGVWQKRMPVASASALPVAAAIGLYGLSLIDLAPKGPVESDVSANNTSVRGTSPNCGR